MRLANNRHTEALKCQATRPRLACMAPLVLLSFAGTALCVRSRLPLCALYQVVLFVPGGGARHIAYSLSSMSAVEAPPRACFGRAVQAAPSSVSGAGSQAFYRHVATAAGCTRPRTLDVLVIQRNSTRRILNLPELLAVLRALRGVHTARAVDLGETACLAPFHHRGPPSSPLTGTPPPRARSHYERPRTAGARVRAPPPGGRAWSRHGMGARAQRWPSSRRRTH